MPSLPSCNGDCESGRLVGTPHGSCPPTAAGTTRSAAQRGRPTLSNALAHTLVELPDDATYHIFVALYRGGASRRTGKSPSARALVVGPLNASPPTSFVDPKSPRCRSAKRRPRCARGAAHAQGARISVALALAHARPVCSAIRRCLKRKQGLRQRCLRCEHEGAAPPPAFACESMLPPYPLRRPALRAPPPPPTLAPLPPPAAEAHVRRGRCDAARLPAGARRGALEAW